jgi:hypothetical protein
MHFGRHRQQNVNPGEMFLDCRWISFTIAIDRRKSQAVSAPVVIREGANSFQLRAKRLRNPVIGADSVQSAGRRQ